MAPVNGADRNSLSGLQTAQPAGFKDEGAILTGKVHCHWTTSFQSAPALHLEISGRQITFHNLVVWKPVSY